jgi:hypothetical protein
MSDDVDAADPRTHDLRALASLYRLKNDARDMRLGPTLQAGTVTLTARAGPD